MNKFSNFKFKKINEQEITLDNNVEETTNKEDVNVVTNVPEEVKQEFDLTKGVKLFSKLFESSEMARVYHLQSSGDGSYAGHKALDEYYELITELTDDLVETYSGQYGIVDEYDVINTSDTKAKDRLQYFEELAKFITEDRNISLSEKDKHLQSLVDAILSLVYRTIYKLKFLK